MHPYGSLSSSASLRSSGFQQVPALSAHDESRQRCFGYPNWVPMPVGKSRVQKESPAAVFAASHSSLVALGSVTGQANESGLLNVLSRNDIAAASSQDFQGSIDAVCTACGTDKYAENNGRRAACVFLLFLNCTCFWFACGLRPRCGRCACCSCCPQDGDRFLPLVFTHCACEVRVADGASVVLKGQLEHSGE